MSKHKALIAGLLLAAAAAILLILQAYTPAPDQGQVGGPILGLSATELRKFYQAKETFKKEFVPEEGLGPLFNGRSCFECHGQPNATGLEGRDVVSTGVVRIGKRYPQGEKGKKPLREVINDLAIQDVDVMFFDGGPALERKSITSEFPNKYPYDCQVEIAQVPRDAELVSLRHSPPLLGDGLIDAIPDDAIVGNMFKQLQQNPQMAGRALTQMDPMTSRPRIGRFGWKAQNPTLLIFTQEAMNVECGITTFVRSQEKSATGASRFPPCILKYLPEEPNDKGDILLRLNYFQSLLAPPPRGEITEASKRGERLFAKLQCAVCHIPEMSTGPRVYVADPDSPAPRLKWMEIRALENQPVRAYSDFLVHKMGTALADGLPQGGAKGGEWRTTPLWGLHLKKFYLHDGRTTDLKEAVLFHGGQALSSRIAFSNLPEKDQEDLLAFLKSL